MSRFTPSLLALLGLVAFAGYQNRGRISEMLADARQRSPEPGPDNLRAGEPSAREGFMAEVGKLFGAGTTGGTLSSGLGDLVARFKDAGRGAPADSWVSARANMPIDTRELEAAIGTETLDELGRKTGLSRNELLLRLNTALPEVVNQFTPEGRLPTETEARSFD